MKQLTRRRTVATARAAADAIAAGAEQQWPGTGFAVLDDGGSGRLAVGWEDGPGVAAVTVLSAQLAAQPHLRLRRITSLPLAAHVVWNRASGAAEPALQAVRDAPQPGHYDETVTAVLALARTRAVQPLVERLSHVLDLHGAAPPWPGEPAVRTLIHLEHAARILRWLPPDVRKIACRLIVDGAHADDALAEATRRVAAGQRQRTGHQPTGRQTASQPSGDGGVAGQAEPPGNRTAGEERRR